VEREVEKGGVAFFACSRARVRAFVFVLLCQCSGSGRALACFHLSVCIIWIYIYSDYITSTSLSTSVYFTFSFLLDGMVDQDGVIAVSREWCGHSESRRLFQCRNLLLIMRLIMPRSSRRMSRDVGQQPQAGGAASRLGLLDASESAAGGAATTACPPRVGGTGPCPHRDRRGGAGGGAPGPGRSPSSTRLLSFSRFLHASNPPSVRLAGHHRRHHGGGGGGGGRGDGGQRRRRTEETEDRGQCDGDSEGTRGRFSKGTRGVQPLHGGWEGEGGEGPMDRSSP
jgi:hypothetical protein